MSFIIMVEPISYTSDMVMVAAFICICHYQYRFQLGGIDLWVSAHDIKDQTLDLNRKLEITCIVFCDLWNI